MPSTCSSTSSRCVGRTDVVTDPKDLPARATRGEALNLLYDCVNHPTRAGPMWVTYKRSQIDAMLDMVKELLIAEGYEFRPITKGEGDALLPDLGPEK